MKCESCRKAYTSFQTLQKFLIGASVAFAATAGVPSDMKFRIILAGSAIISTILAYIINDLQKNFVYVDYVHAEID